MTGRRAAHIEATLARLEAETSSLRSEIVAIKDLHLRVLKANVGATLGVLQDVVNSAANGQPRNTGG